MTLNIEFYSNVLNMKTLLSKKQNYSGERQWLLGVTSGEVLVLDYQGQQNGAFGVMESSVS